MGSIRAGLAQGLSWQTVAYTQADISCARGGVCVCVGLEHSLQSLSLFCSVASFLKMFKFDKSTCHSFEKNLE